MGYSPWGRKASDTSVRPSAHSPGWQARFQPALQTGHFTEDSEALEGPRAAALPNGVLSACSCWKQGSFCAEPFPWVGDFTKQMISSPSRGALESPYEYTLHAHAPAKDGLSFVSARL